MTNRLGLHMSGGRRIFVPIIVRTGRSVFFDQSFPVSGGSQKRGGLRTLLFLLLCLSLCSSAGCSRDSDVLIISRTLQRQTNDNPGVPNAFAESAPSAGQLYWVEGVAKNTASEELHNVEITFVVSDGNTRTLLVAKVEKIPAGATVPFSTGRHLSSTALHLAEEAPEITIGM